MSSTPDPANPSPEHSRNGDEKKRLHALNEILESEENYLMDLAFVLSEYMEPMGQTAMLSDKDLNTLFGDIVKIFEFQEQFYRRLLAIASLPTIDQAIGGLFLEQAEGFKAYTSFCTNQPQALAILMQLANDARYQTLVVVANASPACLRSPGAFSLGSPQSLGSPSPVFFNRETEKGPSGNRESRCFSGNSKRVSFSPSIYSFDGRDVLEEIQAAGGKENRASHKGGPTCPMSMAAGKRNMQLEALFLTPISRICKYPLLLHALAKYTPPTHPDWPMLGEAAQAISEVAQYINDVKKKVDNVQELIRLQMRMTNWPRLTSLLSYGPLLKSGRLAIPDRRLDTEGGSGDQNSGSKKTKGGSMLNVVGNSSFFDKDGETFVIIARKAFVICIESPPVGGSKGEKLHVQHVIDPRNVKLKLSSTTGGKLGWKMIIDAPADETSNGKPPSSRRSSAEIVRGAVIFRAHTMAERESWILAINEAISQNFGGAQQGGKTVRFADPAESDVVCGGGAVMVSAAKMPQIGSILQGMRMLGFGSSPLEITTLDTLSHTRPLVHQAIVSAQSSITATQSRNGRKALAPLSRGQPIAPKQSKAKFDSSTKEEGKEKLAGPKNGAGPTEAPRKEVEKEVIVKKWPGGEIPDEMKFMYEALAEEVTQMEVNDAKTPSPVPPPAPAQVPPPATPKEKTPLSTKISSGIKRTAQPAPLDLSQAKQWKEIDDLCNFIEEFTSPSSMANQKQDPAPKDQSEDKKSEVGPNKVIIPVPAPIGIENKKTANPACSEPIEPIKEEKTSISANQTVGTEQESSPDNQYKVAYAVKTPPIIYTPAGNTSQSVAPEELSNALKNVDPSDPPRILPRVEIIVNSVVSTRSSPRHSVGTGPEIAEILKIDIEHTGEDIEGMEIGTIIEKPEHELTSDKGANEAVAMEESRIPESDNTEKLPGGHGLPVCGSQIMPSIAVISAGSEPVEEQDTNSENGKNSYSDSVANQESPMCTNQNTPTKPEKSTTTSKIAKCTDQEDKDDQSSSSNSDGSDSEDDASEPPHNQEAQEDEPPFLPTAQEIPSAIPSDLYQAIADLCQELTGVPTCHECHEPIKEDQEGVTANGNSWHTKCFRCHTCENPLFGEKVYLRSDGKMYCVHDYEDLMKCGVCGESIGCGQYMTSSQLEGMVVHPTCFVCATCKVDVTIGLCVMNGVLYCHEHYSEACGLLCHRCKKPIGSQYLTALDSPWHPECFACYEPTCNESLAGKQFFVLDDVIYCLQHYCAHTGMLCGECGGCLGDGVEYVTLGKSKLHTTCIKCFKCKQSLSLDEKIRLVENHTYHPDCVPK